MMVSSDLHMAKVHAQVSSDTKQEVLSMVQLLEGIENTPLDRQSIPQESLDLANKFRASLFPWRGQFSPELVELFLNHYSQDTSVILDPFAGSGTTLFEATRKGLVCYAAEINPSAIEMARTAHFSNLSLAQRKDAIQVAVALAEECIHPFTWDLFSYQNLEQPPQSAFGDSLESVFNNLIKQVENRPLVYNLLSNAIIRYMNYNPPRTEMDFLRALQEHARIVKSLPFDEVLMLRAAKRIGSNIRQNFSTYKGRQEAREAYLDFLNKYPYRAKVFERFISYIRQMLRNDPLDEQTVLERGYF